MREEYSKRNAVYEEEITDLHQKIQELLSENQAVTTNQQDLLRQLSDMQTRHQKELDDWNSKLSELQANQESQVKLALSQQQDELQQGYLSLLQRQVTTILSLIEHQNQASSNKPSVAQIEGMYALYSSHCDVCSNRCFL